MKKDHGAILLRLAISGLFLWFGITNITNPSAFLGYLPGFAFNIGIAPTTILLLTGICETFFGLLLLTGFFTRITAIILGIHLLTISIGLGYNDVAVRDWALTFATFAIAIYGPDSWTLDQNWGKIFKKSKR